MSSFILGKPLPRPSLTIFIALQTLDILTTMIGLQLGAEEGSFFIGRLMRIGPLPALLISKIIAVFLVALAMRYKRERLVVLVNFAYAALVTWNLVLIVLSGIGNSL